jgi:Asp-tRNA(Asn)/Glu-tRNA(Gln) amidotransferase A subunit family amidase
VTFLSVRAVIEVNPDALEIAEGLDREREDGEVRSPLHGIPFLVKDVSVPKVLGGLPYLRICCMRACGIY